MIHAVAHDKHILLERAAILAVATVVCAVLTFITGVAVLSASWPDDPARGGLWFSAAAMESGGALCLVCALIAYPLMLWGLSRTKLTKSLPVVFAVSIGTMAATAGVVGPIAAGFSLVFSAIAMGICRKVVREHAPRGEAARGRRGAIVPLGFGAAAGMLFFPLACFVLAAASGGVRAIPASTFLFFGVPIGGCIGAVAGWCLQLAAADPESMGS
jgi:hypothetical protein